MSQNWYFKNLTNSEYIHASGNGSFSDTLAYDNPRFIVWVMMEKWKGKEIRCFPEHEILRGYNPILLSYDKTAEYGKEFNILNM